ncbi:MAG: hypothetical protein HYY50_04975 [Candidatus Kerfeldbacteria bacterium]|nr:hypothetical protein [Candidatus Kerfeldbacteria bacterium]
MCVRKLLPLMVVALALVLGITAQPAGACDQANDLAKTQACATVSNHSPPVVLAEAEWTPNFCESGTEIPMNEISSGTMSAGPSVQSTAGVANFLAVSWWRNTTRHHVILPMQGTSSESSTPVNSTSEPEGFDLRRLSGVVTLGKEFGPDRGQAWAALVSG